VKDSKMNQANISGYVWKDSNYTPEQKAKAQEFWKELVMRHSEGMSPGWVKAMLAPQQ